MESCQRLVGGGCGCEDGLSADGCQTLESHLQERKRTERERSEESSGRRTAETVGSTHTHTHTHTHNHALRERGTHAQAGLETHHSMRAASSASDTKSFSKKRPGRCA